MPGKDEQAGGVFSYVSLEERVPQDHPLRAMRKPVDEALRALRPRVRERVEEVFGWMKTVGLIRKTRHRGVHRVGWTFVFTAAVYNLVRLRNLQATA